MAVYILSFSNTIGNKDNPRGQANFYVGYAENVQARLEEHRAQRGASITAAAVQQGMTLTVVAVFEGDRSLERRIKNLKATPKIVAALRAGKVPFRLPAPIFVQ